ncbi:hypothetical protein P0136_11435 [Lentisphaerota bacterium ZTH]|nr:hypothetical protein JYG24_11045 [Lentisphaerota bacterium]WET05970.1 hypothetical protein P0136_11435 [Lentisphaerota bacterium ZTH]
MNTIFHKWTEAVNFLNRKINRNRLLPGKNVRLTDTGDGVEIDFILNSGPPVYSGGFKCLVIGDKLKVIDGLARRKGICGYAYAAEKLIHVPEVELPIAKLPSGVCVNLTYNEAAGIYETQIGFYDNLPNGAKQYLGQVHTNDLTGSTVFHQVWDGDTINFNNFYWL